MKILVTGANGFIGRNLADALELEHDVVRLTRQTVDLTNREAVDAFFKDKYFDVILHCAMVGGRRNIVDNPKILYDNLAMFYNLRRNQLKYDKMINFGSGAELDRHGDIDENNYFRDVYPIDYYGMAKNITLRLVENEDKCFSIRLFNVFGIGEESARFIVSNIQRYIDKEPMVINQDRLMDFFYIDDLIELIKFFLEKNSTPEEINAVYKQKYKLSEIIDIINDLSDYTIDVTIEKEGYNKCYVGNSNRIDLLPVKFKGLEQAIREIYNQLK
jgi:GDP-L-fucose synthase